MAYTTVNKSTDYFNTKLYTGNGSTQSITGVGFQPDWVWIKERGGVNNHMLFDSNRGTSKYMSSNTSGNVAPSYTFFSIFIALTITPLVLVIAIDTLLPNSYFLCSLPFEMQYTWGSCKL